MKSTTKQKSNVKDSLNFTHWDLSTPVAPVLGNHCYSRSQRGRIAFPEEADYIVFLALLKQGLRLPPHNRLLLYSYSLTDRSYQLLFAASDPLHIQKLIHALIVSYNGYFIRKYATRKAIFFDVYKSTDVVDVNQLADLVLNLHSQPTAGWRRTSQVYYQTTQTIDWVASSQMLRLVGGRAQYQKRARVAVKLAQAGINGTKKSPSRAIPKRSWRS